MADRDDVIDTLNNLIETSHDGEYGFRELAEHAKTPELQHTFSRHAEQCRTAAADLQRAVQEQGGKPEEGGTALGALHRGWVTVRTALTSKDDLALLEEAERGEDSALASYRKAATQELPQPVRALLEQQMAGVQRNHDEIKQLRDRQKQQS